MNVLPPFVSPVRRWLVAVGLAGLALSLHAQTAATGAIEGRVFDSRRGTYLEKARITIDGSKQEAFTDSTGGFRLLDVPAGTITLKIFYTGLGSHTEVVAVAAGQTVQRDITLSGVAGPDRAAAGETIKLDAFTVASSKQMEANDLAINEQ